MGATSGGVVPQSKTRKWAESGIVRAGLVPHGTGRRASGVVCTRGVQPPRRYGAILFVLLGAACNERALDRAKRADAGPLPIDVELLAQEARQKKLDQQPDTQQGIRQILREAVLAEARRGLPAPADIPQDEVRAYFESHRADFREPERRRVAHIVVKDKETAQKVLALAKKANARDWGELFQKHSLDAPKKGTQGPPLELAGDLGIVGPLGDARGDNPRVPPEVRAAVFEIGAIGEVLGRAVEAEGGYHVVRMVGKSDAHERTLTDADRSIRVAILQAKIAEREKTLEIELRKQFAVTIDEQALAKVEVPPAAPPDAKKR